MSVEIYERSPTRVDLAGGTLDCWPLYLFLNNPVTVNVAIDIFTHCHLLPRSDRKVILKSDDLKVTKSYESLEEALTDSEPAFDLHRVHLDFWQPAQGFELRTRSESPIGGGLGGSSSLCISILKAFCRFLDRKMDTYEMVRVASHIEARLLKKPTGTQDYFPPIFGGLCTIHYEIPGPRVEVESFADEIFDGRFLLVYTGRSHHSGINNWQVIKSYLDGDLRTQKAMQTLANISKDLQKCVAEKRWESLTDLFAREFTARVELSEGFSSPEIQKLKMIAESEKATAKICGAGGGGCVLIWCQDRHAEKVAKRVSQEGFQVLAARPWNQNLQ